MKKLKMENDLSYCSGVGCEYTNKCKRFEGNYERNDSAHWYVSAKHCIENKNKYYIELALEDAYNGLNFSINQNPSIHG